MTLPEQVNVKLNLVEREIVTHRWGEGKKRKRKKKKRRLSDPINPIKVYTDFRQVAEMLTHTD